MIKNIVFDIGNVLVTFYPASYFLKHFKDEGKTKNLCEKVFSHEAWGLYDQGIYQKEDLHKVYAQAYPDKYCDISYILENWMKLMELIPSTLVYMRELKKRGYQIYLLSNISKDSAEYLKSCMPFFEEVDGGIYSYKVKINKPDKQIYEALLNTYHLHPQETIFFDDNYDNIVQAKQMGIHGVQFIEFEDAKMECEELIRRSETC